MLQTLLVTSDQTSRANPFGDAPSDGLVSNGVLLGGSRLVVAGLGWAGTVLIVRELSTDDWGRFSFVFGVLGLLSFATDLGSSRVVLQGLAAERGDRGVFAGSYVLLRLALGVLAYIIALTYVVLGGYSSDVVLMMALAGCVLLISAPSDGIEAVFQSHMRLRAVAEANVLGQVAQLVSTVVVALVRPTALLFVLPALLFDVVAAAWKLLAVRVLMRLRYVVRLSTWASVLRQAAPIAIGTALATLYLRVDLVLLSRLDTFEAVGRYGVAVKFVTLFGFLPLALMTALLPLLVRSWPGDLSAFHRVVQRATMLVTVLAGAVAVGFLPVAGGMTQALYGEEYGVAARAAQIIVASECVMYLSLVGLNVLVTVARNKEYVLITAVGLVLNVCANLVLVPRLSFEGAAIAAAVTNVAVAVAVYAVATRVVGVRQQPVGRQLVVVGCAVAGVAIGAGADQLLAWWLAAPVGLVAYAVAVELSGAAGPGGLRGLLRDERPPRPAGGSIRLVALSHTSLVSGAEIALERVLTGARARGWEVTACVPPGSFADRLRGAGFDVVPIVDLKLPEGILPFAAARLGVRQLRAARVIRTSCAGVDVLLVNGLLSLPAVRLAHPDARVVWLVHDVVRDRRSNALLRLGYRAVDLAVGVSEAAAAPVRERAVATRVVPNGTAWPVEPAPPRSGPCVLGCAGLLTPWKGHRVLLEAVSGLPPHVSLEIVGGVFPKDTEYAAGLRRRAGEADLRGRVTFSGPVDDLLARMRRWTLLVSPSTDPEAGPLVALEAMSVGLPVVATAHGGPVEFVGNAGVLLPPGDVSALRTALEQLIDDPARRAAMGEAGRREVAARFRLDERVNELLDVLQETAERDSDAEASYGLRSAFRKGGKATTTWLPDVVVDAVRARAFAFPGGEVVRIVTALEVAGIRAWLVGGWGVDALLGAQTRRHSDLDVAVEAVGDAVNRAVAVLVGLGYESVTTSRETSELMPFRLILRHATGRTVDLVPVCLGPTEHRAWCGDWQWLDRAGGLSATGSIASAQVPCISATAQLALRSGYRPRRRDRRDRVQLEQHLRSGASA